MDKIKFFTGSQQKVERDVNEFLEINKDRIGVEDIRYQVYPSAYSVMIWYKTNLAYGTQF